MVWTIKLYQTSNGREPVADFIRELNRSNPIEVAKVRRSISRLQEHGPIGIDSRPMGDRLFEIRIKGNVVWLLHAITKKDQRTPKPDLDLARSRATEILSQE